MDFLNEFGKRFSNVARSVSGGSKEPAEVTRLNGELREAEAALEQLYARYGRLCFDGFGGGEEAEGLSTRIRAGRLQVEELTDRRDAARDYKRCPGCGAIHAREAKFCSACGKRLPDAIPKPEPVAAGEYCPACGALREDDAPRCPVCGAYFDAEPEAKAPTAPAPVMDASDIEEPDHIIE